MTEEQLNSCVEANAWWVRLCKGAGGPADVGDRSIEESSVVLSADARVNGLLLPILLTDKRLLYLPAKPSKPSNPLMLPSASEAAEEAAPAPAPPALDPATASARPEEEAESWKGLLGSSNSCRGGGGRDWQAGTHQACDAAAGRQAEAATALELRQQARQPRATSGFRSRRSFLPNGAAPLWGTL